jgi:gliding motility-associated-like protein
MRVTFTLLILFLFVGVALAQPSNDDCATPLAITLTAPSPCPSTSPTTDVFNLTNINATPTTPYPALQSCDGDGALDGPAAEVWVSFTPVSHNTTFTITGGLNTPNFVIYEGADCAFLQAIWCGSSDPNTGTFTSTVSLSIGDPYYMMISGDDVDDQGDFTLTIENEMDCGACVTDVALDPTPPPTNGTYSSGQTIIFCFTINNWDVQGTVEWLHAITIDFGPGWDLSSIGPSPPEPCDGPGTGNGTWGWYESWVGCNTGETFGPGFAFEGGSGIDGSPNCNTGGTANDGDPGNNWGDPGCNSLPEPLEFCWSIAVGDCPPNFTENDLNMSVQVWSDGDSGSWSQTGCNSGTLFSSLASAVCCDDPDPISTYEPETCPGADDISITVQGGGGLDPTALYNFNVLDGSGNIVYSCNACSGEVVIDNLPPGFYGFNVENVVTGCVRSLSGTVPGAEFPTVTMMNDLPACLGDDVTLTADLTLCVGCPDPAPGATITYEWTGPSNYMGTGPQVVVTEPGVYTVTGYYEGCPAEPVSIEYIPSQVEVGITSDYAEVCEGDPVMFTGTGGLSYSWLNVTTGETAGDVNPYITNINESPTTVEVTSYNADGCPATEELSITIIPPPVLSDTMFGSYCAGSQLFVQILGADIFFWPDDGSTANPRTFSLPSGTYTYDVEGTSASTGCTSEYTISFEIVDSPEPTITPNNETICLGDDITLTANGGSNSVFNWSTGDLDTESITVSPTEDTYYSVIEFEGDCFGSYEILITVEEPLAGPDITCGDITPASVEFTWPAISGADDYEIVVLTGQTGTLDGTTFTVDNLNPSETVTIEVTALGGMCGGITSVLTCESESCPPVLVGLTPVSDICLDAGLATFPIEVTITDATMNGDTTWSGTGITGNGIFDPVAADTGAHEIIMTYTEGLCNYRDTIVINIFQTPTADFNVSNNEICSSDSITVTYTGNASNTATYTWNFDGGTATPGTGQGPHNVTWLTGGDKTITLTVEEDNCTSTEVTQTVTVDDPLSALSVICAPSTTTSVEFNWNDVPGSEGYEVTVLSGQTGVLSGTSFTVDNLQPLEMVTIEVTALNSGACGNVSTEMTCTASACPAFGIDIDAVADICLEPNAATVTLNATITGGDGNGTITWDGPGVTDGVAGIFDPTDAGAGVHTITALYEEGPCSGSNTITITVFDTPTADFTVSMTPVCIGEETTITYTGSADPTNSGFTWNFGGGTATPGTGEGPHQVSWATAGDKTVTLIVTENGCTSEVFSQTVSVEGPLAAPVINCDPSSTEITFTWDDVAGATGYNVNVITGQPGTQTGNSFTLTGLTPLENVTIEVEAIGTGPCGNSTAQESCVAEDCPDVVIVIDAVDPICFYAFTVPTGLNATVTGGLGGGVEDWDGPGIIDNNNGTFDPQVAGIGSHTINFSYTEGTCSYNSSIIIVINAVPTASFTLDDPVCVDQTSNVLFTGSAGATATFDWGFDSGTINSGADQGPFDVSWSTSGTKDVTLTVTENDCISEPFSLTTEVTDPIADPIIDCESTDTSVIFNWLDVAGATGYSVSGPAGTMTGNTYEIFGLLPGTEVGITVTAETNNPCGSSSAFANCIASNCPDVFLNIDAPAELCADAGITTLTANPQGGSGTGTGVWFGNGFSNAATGEFNPALVSGQTVTIQYIYTENVICVYDTTFDIIIHEIPEASFTLDSPICVDDSATATFTGTAPSGSTFEWNFGGGVSAIPNTDMGPHNISWSTSGDKTVTLQINNNGCFSQVISHNVEVAPNLELPVISCGTSTTSSITFTWNPVPGATGYEVMDIDGPAGTLTGNTYVVTGLTPEQIVNIEVTALSDGICNNTSATSSCQADACPDVTVTVDGPDAICIDNAASFDFTINGSSDEFEIEYSLNNGASQTITATNSGSLDFTQLSETTTIEILSFTNQTATVCTYTGASDWTINVNGPPTAGTALAAPRFCMSTTATVTLADLLNGADGGGTWSETSDITSQPGGFNAGLGTFNIFGQQAGTYKFTYMLDAPDPCPDDQTEVSVIIDPLPNANAGEDQIIFCNLGLVSLDGSGSVGGNTYLWTPPSGVSITNPADLMIDVSQEGIYSLQVTNEFGCVETDEVNVALNDDVPVGDLLISDITCFGTNDGAIFFENVTGGSPPYSYSFNGGDFSSQSTFSGLGPDSYTLIVQDANGCFSELAIDLTEPAELVVNLVANLPGDPFIEFGDSVQLDVVFQSDNPIDTIIWEPQGLVKESESSVVITPLATTSISVTVIDINGCSDSDNITIFVEKTRPVYIPNVFSPNEDGINDILYIQAGAAVTNIKSFLVFNRWGEPVFESYDALPNLPALGWDGKFRGKYMNPAVFTYFAEIEFIDGEVILFKGAVSLMR